MSVVHDLDDIYYFTRSYDPFEIAFHLDFDIEYVDYLPGGRLGLAVPELKVLFLVNTIKDTMYSYFICAHELTHGTEHEGIQAFYNKSNRTKSRMEQEADAGAIHILCNYYLEEFPEIDRLNVPTVASFFDLDEEFYSLIERELKGLID
ncbi:ImmA/IrrE family metallo-endopeptidase [Enterococcus hulanensis]|uniref:ImmA/IrrE family metallo-endopeptidase n=1 Tax=Enterococcus hulanensis TaxID=2559929 RepID=UPI001F5C14B1|nr:ImmA/IrrE family metallo-endopeptidase [Enterococcus hulanensis]